MGWFYEDRGQKIIICIVIQLKPILISLYTTNKQIKTLMHYHHQQNHPQYHTLHQLDQRTGRNRHTSRVKRGLSITPWDDSQATQGLINPFVGSSHTRKNISQIVTDLPSPTGDTLNFVNGSPKGKRNRSDLGKLRNKLQFNKGNQFFLNLNKIEFLQYEKKQQQNPEEFAFQPNPRPNVKDFSSIQNNFFIKSYFFPNNPKISKKDEPQTSQAKRHKEYRKIKQIKGPSFIAIKSVDLKEKFPIDFDQENNSDDEIDPRTEKYYTNFRTISVLGSRKSRRIKNSSMQENYQTVYENEFHKYKTIESTKESLREITDPLKERNFLSIDDKFITKSLAVSNNPAIIATNESFIRKKNSKRSFKMDLSSSKMQGLAESDETAENDSKKSSKKFEKSNQPRQGMQISSIGKRFTVQPRQKSSRIQRLREIKQKNELQNFLHVMSPYVYDPSVKPSQNQQTIDITHQNLPKRQRNVKDNRSYEASSRLKKRVDSSNMNTTLRIFDKLQEPQRAFIRSLNKEIMAKQQRRTNK